MFLDNQGLIIQNPEMGGDAGDSLHRAGSFEFVKRFRQHRGVAPSLHEQENLPLNWHEARPLYEVTPGIYVRHPDKTKWYSNPWTTSRDQLIPAILAMGINKEYGPLWSVTWRILARFFFAQNIYRNWVPASEQRPKVPDTFIGHLAILIRAWGWWGIWLYPLLLVFDLVGLIGEAISLLPLEFRSGKLQHKGVDDVDDNNNINGHLQAISFAPTPFSWLARRLYARFRPVNSGNLILSEPLPIMGALAWYHRKENGGSPFLAELYRPVIMRYFT